ncbi:MAG TPA: chaperone modulator CbpM [Puia sp.]|nr:chaperone modulator CbpM [Puia sp.]
MADQEIIPLEIYCSYYQVEPEFLHALEEHGLIRISYQETKGYIHPDDMPQLEHFSRLYYELNINVPGIDALEHILEKLKQVQQEAAALRNRLKIYE